MAAILISLVLSLFGLFLEIVLVEYHALAYFLDLLITVNLKYLGILVNLKHIQVNRLRTLRTLIPLLIRNTKITMTRAFILLLAMTREVIMLTNTFLLRWFRTKKSFMPSIVLWGPRWFKVASFAWRGLFWVIDEVEWVFDDFGGVFLVVSMAGGGVGFFYDTSTLWWVFTCWVFVHNHRHIITILLLLMRISLLYLPFLRRNLQHSKLIILFLISLPFLPRNFFLSLRIQLLHITQELCESSSCGRCFKFFFIF